ncbi:uncharacterized protein [Henckelia pumila]|uniref:uncharacterized protein n=1 Tax=Henckelia pumila TaxID=405737 RepID=UPI003C6DDC3D
MGKMADQDDWSSHGSVGRWGDDDAQGHHREYRQHHERHHRDDHGHFSMHLFVQMGPKPLIGAKASELLSLRQGLMLIYEYQQKFFELLPYFPQISDSTEAKYNLFLQGLNPEIHDCVSVGDDMTYEGLISRGLQAEERSRGVMCFGKKGQGPCSHYDWSLEEGLSIDRGSWFWFGFWISRHSATEATGTVDGRFNLKPHASSQVFALRHDQAVDENERVIACTFLLCSMPDSVLIDTGEGARPQLPLVSALRAYRALESGGEGYLIHAVDMFTRSVGIDDFPVVNEFSDVFLDEILDFPPIREVEFGIELMPGTSPISRELYLLAPSKMRELKQQLKDLLNKGYIRPSISPWGAPIKKRINTTQDHQASYANTKRIPLQFEMGEKVFLRVSPFPRILRFGLKGMLSPRFIGPFDILESVGDLSYRLSLPPYLSNIYDVFHLSLLRWYVADESHILQPSDVQLDTDLTYVERLLRILNQEVKRLRTKAIPLVLFQWQRRGTKEAT